MWLSPRIAAIILLVLLAIYESEAGRRKSLRRSKRNNVSCKPQTLVRYRLTVNTLWTKRTFPKMYPNYRPHAQWSSLIGRTHGDSFTMWTEGENATEGVRMFAEKGDSTYLDRDAVQGYSDVLDTFMAPAVSRGAGQTSAVIILDGRHSKLSFMMKIIPSPDWFIGVSGMDMCFHGRWRKKLQWVLPPMDAGTDQGLTFTAPNWPNDPPLPLSVITSTSPDHPASSFYYPELSELPLLAYMELEMVSLFRHRRTFLELPQHWNNAPGVSNSSKHSNAETATTTTATTTTTTMNPNMALHPLVMNDGKEDHVGVINKDDVTTQDLRPGSDDVIRAGHLKVSNQDGEKNDGSAAVVENKKPKEADASVEGRPLFRIISRPRAGEKERKPAGHDPAEVETTSTVRGGTEVKAATTGSSVDSATRQKPVFSFRELRPGSSRQPKRPRSRPRPSEPRKDISPLSLEEPLFPELTAGQLNPAYENLDVDCEVAEWSEWSACTQTCGFGSRTRSRKVLRLPEHGGTICPRLKQEELCGSMRSCQWQHFSFLGGPKKRTRSGRVKRRRRQ